MLVVSQTAPCPKCENPKAFFMQLQIRSAHEPSKFHVALDVGVLAKTEVVKGR